MVDLEQKLVSYVRTGALLKQMDMVVSVCTSVVHLAGALNIPFLASLSPHADWRWFIDETESTWYPNTAILRQEKSGNWVPLIEETNQYLDKYFS